MNVTPDAFLESHFQQQRNRIQQSYRELDTTSKGYVTVGDLKDGLVKRGLDSHRHPELKLIVQDLIRTLQLKKEVTVSPQQHDNLRIEFEDFFNLIGDKDNQTIVQRAFNNELAIPDWEDFCREISEIFESVRPNDGMCLCAFVSFSLTSSTDGKVADYIPQLAEADPNLFGLSICTVDGQRFNIGDTDHEFTIQSCSKVFNYCIGCDDHGPEHVHKYVGFEPSGVSFNAFTLDDNNKPHNPMINAGAIAVCSLLKSEMSASKRFMYATERYSDFAGGAKIGFDNSVFLSEKDTADRNFALTYYMQENGVFPKDKNSLDDTLDLYFQLCSVLVTTESLSSMAATLANGGTCPITNKKIVSPDTVKCALQLMLSCGMYDFSGEWSISVGLPAKSGVAGACCVVIPSVMGLTLFSPKLDKRGNSARAVEFCIRASSRFKWSIFDQLFLHADDQEEEHSDEEDDVTFENAPQQDTSFDAHNQTDGPQQDLKRKRFDGQQGSFLDQSKKLKHY
jgi:glutaminase